MFRSLSYSKGFNFVYKWSKLADIKREISILCLFYVCGELAEDPMLVASNYLCFLFLFLFSSAARVDCCINN